MCINTLNLNKMKFSILIPAFKQKYLHEAIASCLSQTYNDFEVIVVDDASPEDLKSVIDDFHDSRIKFYRNKNNCGAVNVVDNWNICLSYAHGDYVICMGDDDMLMPHCLEEYVKLFEKYPNLGVYHAWTELIDEFSNMFELQAPRQEWESVYSLIWNRWNGRLNQFIGDFCFDTKLLRQDGCFYKLPLAWGSDDISAVRAALKGGVANTQKVCFRYRVNSNTISNTGNNEIKIEAILQERTWYQELIAKVLDKPHNENDEKFCHCIKLSMPQYYAKKIRNTLAEDISQNPLHIFKWLSQTNRLGISKLQVVYCALLSFKKGVMQKVR